jgi:hypothetical protein
LGIKNVKFLSFPDNGLDKIKLIEIIKEIESYMNQFKPEVIFTHSNTDLNILDVYAKFYISKFYLGAELLYPTGTTQSPNYRSLGGAGECSSSTGLTCNSQKISAFASLLKVKYQFDSDKFTSIAATEKSQNVLGTEERKISNVASLMAGYVSGGSNQFESSIVSNSNEIKAISLNSNIQPAILMFNSTTPAVNGMPGGMLTNTTFVRLDYTYENPNYGSFSPAFIWGKINNLNGLKLIAISPS